MCQLLESTIKDTVYACWLAYCAYDSTHTGSHYEILIVGVTSNHFVCSIKAWQVHVGRTNSAEKL